MKHLVKRQRYSGDTSQPTIILASDRQEWGTVVSCWVSDSSGCIATLDVDSKNITGLVVILIVGPFGDGSGSKRVSSIKETCVCDPKFLVLALDEVDIHFDVDWNWKLIDNMWNSYPKWEWSKLLNGLHVVAICFLITFSSRKEN